jgi:hypothetical protein
MSRKPAVDRRSFLKGAAVTGAATLVPDVAANAAPVAAPQAAAAQGAGPTTPPVGVREVDPVVEAGPGPTGRPGSDFMLDVVKSLDFEYVASNVGSSFRGIHESIINNRAYHQEIMHIQRMAGWRNRDITRAHIGTTIESPNVDFARIAQGMGVHAQGPITNPNELGPAIRRALEVVKGGEPSLIDVVTQPR